MNEPEVEKFKMLLETFFYQEVFGVPPSPYFLPRGVAPCWGHPCTCSGFALARCGRCKVLHNWLMSRMQQEFAQDK